MSAPAISEFIDLTVSVSDALATKFSFGLPIGIFDHSVTANRVDGPYSSLDDVIAAGFTAVAEPEVYGWASSVFSQGAGVDQVKIGREDVGDASWTATYNAVRAEDPEFYYVNIESRAEADILLVAAAVEATGTSEYPNFFVAQSSDAALLAGTAGNVGEDLQTQNYHRTALIHHALDDSAAGDDESDGYLDGAWTSRCGGFNLDGPNGRGQWAFKQLTGIPFNPLTSAQAAALYAVNANLYGRTKGLSFTSKGTAASGRYIDVTTTADWVKLRLEEKLITALVSSPTGLDLTPSGLGVLERVGDTLIAEGVAFGHLNGASDNRITWPAFNEISDEDRAARQVTGTAVLYLAGGMIKLTMAITLVP